ncbi:hypothetical protein QCA50_005154 [Cerrena zonata]|uniref:Pali-domain-containing protein n=1 Tax=Cerrena zonata TaxID=2478898 RepID=A0AAW0GE46_9APHY
MSAHLQNPRHSHQSHHAHHHHHHPARPLVAYRGTSIFAFLFLLASFVLFLLVAISIPIIKPIYLFIFDFGVQEGQPQTSIATDIRFGVWGFCASSNLNLPTVFENDGSCTSPRLGYDIPEDLLALTGHPELANSVLKGLTVLLVLHPVCAGLAFLGMFTSLFLASHCMSILSLLITVVTAIVSSVVLAADLALTIVARDRVSNLTSGIVTVGWGNGVWMVVAGVACTWFSVILLSAVACRCCGYRKYYRY